MASPKVRSSDLLPALRSPCIVGPGWARDGDLTLSSGHLLGYSFTYAGVVMTSFSASRISK